MRQTVTDAQRSVARSILTTAMAVLRDDQPFNPANTVFGHNFAAEPLPGTPGMEYRFENPVLPRTRVTLYTHEDPADHSFDRASVKRVPTAFTVSFSPLMEGITRSDLENLLSLDIGYWIDGHGDRWPGNDMGVFPPEVLVHCYRYRASSLSTSRFPVDVQLSFGDPDPQDTDENALKVPVLMSVHLTRHSPRRNPIRPHPPPLSRPAQQ